MFSIYGLSSGSFLIGRSASLAFFKNRCTRIRFSHPTFFHSRSHILILTTSTSSLFILYNSPKSLGNNGHCQPKQTSMTRHGFVLGMVSAFALTQLFQGSPKSLLTISAQNLSWFQTSDNVTVQYQQKYPHSSIDPIENNHNHPNKNKTRIELLLDLVDSNPDTSCPDGLYLVNDTRLFHIDADEDDHDHDVIVNKNRTHSASKIPKIIHMTSKTRCVTKQFYENINLWRAAFPDYSLLLHNDAAVNALLLADSPPGDDGTSQWALTNHRHEIFPELQKASYCLMSGAAIADLWRAVILYEFGGVYTDIDNAPPSDTDDLETLTTQLSTSDALFVVEQGGWLSQYFMATSTHHPLMWFVVHKTIQRLYSLNDVDGQYVPRTTGPGALKYAFIAFMNDQGPNIYEGFGNCNKNHPYKYGQVTNGTYYLGGGVLEANETTTMVANSNISSVTVLGTKQNSNQYVVRESVKSKNRQYNEMNMTHFSQESKKVSQEKVKMSKEVAAAAAAAGENANLISSSTESCFQRIYRKQQERRQQQQRHNQRLLKEPTSSRTLRWLR